MPAETVRVYVAPDSEIADLLDKVGNTSILLEKNGELYRLTKEDDIWADYDPKLTRLALQKTAGALEGVDREELLNDIHLARQQASQCRRIHCPSK